MSTLEVKAIQAPSGYKLAMPAGHIVQVVQAEYSTQTNFSTDSFADTGLTASITPSSTSNKILVVVAANGCMKSDGNTATSMDIRLMRDSTALVSFGLSAGINWINNNNTWGTVGTTKLDSPSTTSAVTYKTQCRSTVNGAYVRLQQDSSVSSITLMEVAG